MCEFAIPGAQNTTVLVVGATSRVGRIVVRKLMLMGYSVKLILPSKVLGGLVPDWFSDLMFLVDSGCVIVLLLLP
ncbi:hypothetical protein L1887_07467 [Cichorium endivia]|nr:hypothetical protein L1887_07467 [Cichorium endivia]